MRRSAYRLEQAKAGRRKRRRSLVIACLVLGIGVFAAWQILPNPLKSANSKLVFDKSVTEQEKEIITQAIKDQGASYTGTIEVSITQTEKPQLAHSVAAYVPVVDYYGIQQATSSEDITELVTKLPESADSADNVSETEISLIPVDKLTDKIKLLALDGNYYLDSFESGAIFRQATFTGKDAQAFDTLDFDVLPSKNDVFKLNQTGVTALTRRMMHKLNTVDDATFFSQKIGDFLADADITHVSNEVSFKDGCSYSNTVFCSPPEMIETLKASGVDVVEITGNHNNDVGAQYNTETIKLYHSLGWGTVGGGLNTAEAAKPWTTDKKGTKLALLGYNYPDSPNGNAIAGPDKAGANSFDFEYNSVEKDIKAAKEQGNFVIVDVQFWECYAYPDGYLEFPQCDGPIPNQAEVFRKIIDLGADMVVGSSAHQPQTYELYNDKPIYYGLGNLYFDQTQWPGTERGIILSHYFIKGKLVQTRLTPTVYNEDYQPYVMEDTDAVSLLERLKAARE